MKRAVILLTVMAIVIAVGGGVALAKTIHCRGGDCFGTNRPDSIYGTNRHDAIFAERGGDFVTGRGGADNLNGGDGNDRVLGGWGDDWIKGGRQDDTVKGDLGNDRITGGSGHNVIRAGDGMRDLIICGDNSRNLIYYDPRLDHFRNCRFLWWSLQKNTPGRSAVSSSGGSTVSVVGLGPSRGSEGSAGSTR